MKQILTTLSIFTLLVSCKEDKKITEETTMETKKETTLKEVLDDKKKCF